MGSGYGAASAGEFPFNSGRTSRLRLCWLGLLRVSSPRTAVSTSAGRPTVPGTRRLGSPSSDPLPGPGLPGPARWHLRQAGSTEEQLLQHGGDACGHSAGRGPPAAAEGLRHRHPLLCHSPPIPPPAQARGTQGSHCSGAPRPHSVCPLTPALGQSGVPGAHVTRLMHAQSPGPGPPVCGVSTWLPGTPLASRPQLYLAVRVWPRTTRVGSVCPHGSPMAVPGCHLMGWAPRCG